MQAPGVGRSVGARCRKHYRKPAWQRRRRLV